MDQIATKVGAGGRLVIPAELRERLDIAPGDTLILMVEDEGLRLLTPAQAIRRAQAMVGAYASPDRDLAAELVEERREEPDEP